MSLENINLDDINQITLDLSIPRIINVMCKQGDLNTRKLLITLTNDGQLFHIDSTITANYKLCKADNTYIYNTVDGIIDGKIYINLPEQCTACAGTVSAELQLVKTTVNDEENKQVIHSMPFNIIVEKSVVSNDAITSTNEFGVLTKIITELDGFTDLKEIDAVLYADLWEGDSAPYTQVISVDAVKGYVNCAMNLAENVTSHQSHAAMNAKLREANISYDENTGFTFTIHGEKPTVDIPITILTGQALNITEVPTYIQGSPVTGVKGNAETEYRTGNVNITLEAIGAASVDSPVFTGSISLGRTPGSTMGANSFAVGNNVTASGYCTHVEGCDNTASGNYMHVEGVGHDCQLYNDFVALTSTISLLKAPISSFNMADASLVLNEKTYAYVTFIPEDSLSLTGVQALDSEFIYRGFYYGRTFSEDNIIFERDINNKQIKMYTQNPPGLSGYINSLIVTEKKSNKLNGTALHIQGTYSSLDSSDYIHVVGNGSSSDARSNAHTLDKYGNAVFAGDVTGTDASGNKVSLLDISTNLEKCAKINDAPTITLLDSSFSIARQQLYKVDNIIFFNVNLSSTASHTGRVNPISITDSTTILGNQSVSAGGSSASNSYLNIPLSAFVTTSGGIYIDTKETFYDVNISGTIITS